MLKHRGPILEHQTSTLASPSDFSMENAKIHRFDRARNSQNARTNPPRIGWQEIHNLFYILRFDQKHKTNWDLVQNRVTLGRSTSGSIRAECSGAERAWAGKGPSVHCRECYPKAGVFEPCQKHKSGVASIFANQGLKLPRKHKTVVAYGRQSPPRSNREPRFSQP